MGITLEHLYFDRVKVPADKLAAFQDRFDGAPLDQILLDQGLTFSTDEDGGFLIEQEQREKLGYLEDWLREIAPFVEDGGRIECAADGDQWRWVFRHQKLFLQAGRTVYDDEETECLAYNFHSQENPLDDHDPE